MVSIKATNVGVDAGLIYIGDVETLKNMGADEPGWEQRQGNVFDVEPGTYAVNYSIPNTWNGNVKGKGTVKVTSGKVVIIDPGYAFDKNWKAVLNTYDYFRKPVDGAIVERGMGGDGCYKVNATLRKVKA
jgi:uncharacterized cupin superfamily protein